MALSDPAFGIPPRGIRIVCDDQCEQVEQTGSVTLPFEECSAHLRAHRIRLRLGFERPVMMVHRPDLGLRFELHPGDPPLDTNDFAIAGEWLLCTPPTPQDCP